MFKKRKTTGGFTLVETLTAAGILSFIITLSFAGFSYFSNKAPEFTDELSYHKAVHNAFLMIENKLSQAIEIIDPIPVLTGGSLTFKDRDNSIVTMKIDAPSSMLCTYINGSAEKQRNGFIPLKVKNIENVEFTALSPAYVMVKIKLKTGSRSINAAKIADSVFFIKLDNANMNI